MFLKKMYIESVRNTVLSIPESDEKTICIEQYDIPSGEYLFIVNIAPNRKEKFLVHLGRGSELRSKHYWENDRIRRSTAVEKNALQEH